MTDTEALRELVVDTLFIFNLTELSMMLEKHYRFTEERFWKLVDSHFQAYQAEKHTSVERINAINLYQETIQTESLLRKKLNGDSPQEFHHQVQNPMKTKNDNTNQVKGY